MFNRRKIKDKKSKIKRLEEELKDKDNKINKLKKEASSRDNRMSLIEKKLGIKKRSNEIVGDVVEFSLYE